MKKIKKMIEISAKENMELLVITKLTGKTINDTISDMIKEHVKKLGINITYSSNIEEQIDAEEVESKAD